jgi:hypothetical protein
VVIVRAADAQCSSTRFRLPRTQNEGPSNTVPSTMCSLREMKTSMLALETGAKGTRNPNPDSDRTEPRRHCQKTQQSEMKGQ